jgi:twitching motility protein PilI
MSEPQAAFQALLTLAQRSRAAARGLPAQADIRPHWSGIGFSLMGSYFVAPIGEVSEMLEVPNHTHLPGVQPWVKGVANVRGRLLPLFDLAMFFGDRLGSSRKHRRVLILETETLYSGLIVDQVFGMHISPWMNTLNRLALYPMPSCRLSRAVILKEASAGRYSDLHCWPRIRVSPTRPSRSRFTIARQYQAF